MAMTRPDRELIAQVMLFSQGFRTAESLASKIVPFFNLCDEQLSPQPHYDFGLRALKAVLASAGILKRERLQETRSSGDNPDLAGLSDVTSEQVILIQSVTETIVPKLVADDVPLLTRFVLLRSVAMYFRLIRSIAFLLTYFLALNMFQWTSVLFVVTSAKSAKRGA
jgi:hypothetical protein